jgi:hypothetical protein
MLAASVVYLVLSVTVLFALFPGLISIVSPARAGPGHRPRPSAAGRAAGGGGPARRRLTPAHGHPVADRLALVANL